SNRSLSTEHTSALQSERGRPRPPPSNRSPLTEHTSALQSERGRPRPPPSNRSPLTEHRSALQSDGLPLVDHSSSDFPFVIQRLTTFQFATNLDFHPTGAAEDGRAPTEERLCVRSRGFCSTG